jgi:hypothetical protein
VKVEYQILDHITKLIFWLFICYFPHCAPTIKTLEGKSN